MTVLCPVSSLEDSSTRGRRRCCGIGNRWDFSVSHDSHGKLEPLGSWFFSHITKVQTMNRLMMASWISNVQNVDHSPPKTGNKCGHERTKSLLHDSIFWCLTKLHRNIHGTHCTIEKKTACHDTAQLTYLVIDPPIHLFWTHHPSHWTPWNQSHVNPVCCLKKSLRLRTL